MKTYCEDGGLIFGRLFLHPLRSRQLLTPSESEKCGSTVITHREQRRGRLNLKTQWLVGYCSPEATLVPRGPLKGPLHSAKTLAYSVSCLESRILEQLGLVINKLIWPFNKEKGPACQTF